MVATILIGKAQNGPGVTGRILFLGDEEDSNFGREIYARSLRQKIVEEWTLLQSYAVPTQPEEMVFKLSRHSVVRGQIWTWLGCYNDARFSGNVRGGTYIGSGVLALNRTLIPDRSVIYVTDVIQELMDQTKQGGVVSVSVFDLNDRDLMTIRNGSNNLLDTPGGPSGTSRRDALRAYIDLTSLDRESDFVSEVIGIVDKAQSAEFLTEFSEVIVGNSSRLGSSARHSRACHFFTPAEWQNYRGAAGQSTGLYRPPKSVERFTLKPSTREQEIRSPDQDFSIEAASLGLVRRDILRLELKVDAAVSRIEKRLQSKIQKDESLIWRVKRSLQLNWWRITLATAAVTVISILTILAFWSVRSFVARF